MSFEKDIKFTEKKIDESWKENINKDKEKNAPQNMNSTQQEKYTQKDRISQKESTEKQHLNFSTFISSLGMQALYHMGEIPNPMTQKKEVNLEAASEVIDIITLLQEKTKNNLTNEEATLIKSLLYDLQMAYVNKINKQ